MILMPAPQGAAAPYAVRRRADYMLRFAEQPVHKHDQRLDAIKKQGNAFFPENFAVLSIFLHGFSALDLVSLSVWRDS